MGRTAPRSAMEERLCWTPPALETASAWDLSKQLQALKGENCCPVALTTHSSLPAETSTTESADPSPGEISCALTSELPVIHHRNHRLKVTCPRTLREPPGDSFLGTAGLRWALAAPAAPYQPAGIPFDGGLRCLCWKILLNYLPLEKALWSSLLKKQRDLYSQFLKEMIIQPGIAKANLGVSREDVTLEDHPLNPNPDSRWNTYFKDNEVLLQIDKDVRRLYPDMAFFQRPTDYPCLLILDPQNEFETLRKRVEQTTLKSQTVARNRSGVTNVSSPLKSTPHSLSEYEVLPNGCEAHWEVVERILFIYAKLNPGIAYVQGMNEIVGPLYYTFATDPNSEWKEHAEADTFFCFTNLMAEIRDNFIKSLDDSQCGITYKMEKVYSTLKEKDVELYLKLQEQNIKPQFFAFRWLTLLLSQEFLLPDVIRIWDSLFADDKRFDFLLLVCCAMLTLIRDQLLEGDFTLNMRLLQDYPISDVHLILKKAKELQDSK
ncbi:TBC1 domain family, member 13 [Columba livia]|uniref:TBC1 domain family member 13 n=1 Tax=Columba livia TaxID=8932 RepID=A0A2I0M3Y5_COLLI|nr:TBC1 domain family, member 13 [Columba livia]